MTAKEFAIQKHESVNHTYDGWPYRLHLQEVVDVAEWAFKEMKIPIDQKIIDACWCHDLIEDCRVTYNDLKNVVGQDVADIVYAVTNEKGRSREERANSSYYEGIRNQKGATFVKLCDRIANMEYSARKVHRMNEKYKGELVGFLTQLFPNSDLWIISDSPLIKRLLNCR